MANAKDITSANTNVLIIGDPGTYKTGFLGTVPGIEILDLDGNMAINRGRDVEYTTIKDLAKGMKLTKVMEAQGLNLWGEGWDKLYKQILDLDKRISDGKGPKAVGFDSLTFMSMLAINKILKDTNQPAPHQGTWGAHHEYFKTIFSMVTAWPVRIFATTHVQRAENDLTQVVEKLPLLAGKLAPLIGAFFNEVYYSEMTTAKDGKQTPIFHTKQTNLLKHAKSPWGVPDGTEMHWDKLKPYLEVAG